MRNKFAENDYIDPIYTQDEESKLRWIAAKQQFVHESGLPSASSITGLFLNFEGASVFSYTMYTERQSKHGKITNVRIHDIYHDMVESMRVSRRNAGGQLYPTPWNSDIPAEAAFGGKDTLLEFYTVANDIYTSGASSTSSYSSEDLEPFGYVGSVMSDAYFGMVQFSDDWGYLGFLEIAENADDTGLANWVFNNGVGGSNWVFGCNQDIMGHSGKGLLGFRMDGVANVELDNVIIENLYQQTPLGSYACGNYYRFTPQTSGGHFKQSEPMQWGFSANDLQAISIISSTDLVIGNLQINNLNNDYSQSYGLSFWTANNIYFKEDALVMIENVQAGILLEEGLLGYDDKPNRAAEACAVRLEIDDVSDYYESYINLNDELNGVTNIVSCNVYGHVTCLGEEDSTFTMYGSYFSDGEICEGISSYDELAAVVTVDESEYVVDQNNEQKRAEAGGNKKQKIISKYNNNNNRQHILAASGAVATGIIAKNRDRNDKISNGTSKRSQANYYASLVSVGIVSSIATIVMLYCHYRFKTAKERKAMREASGHLIENYDNIAENFTYGSI